MGIMIKTTKALTKEQKEKLKLAFEKAYTGPQKPGKIFIIKKGVFVEKRNSIFQRFHDFIFGSTTVEFFDL